MTARYRLSTLLMMLMLCLSAAGLRTVRAQNSQALVRGAPRGATLRLAARPIEITSLRTATSRTYRVNGHYLTKIWAAPSQAGRDRGTGRLVRSSLRGAAYEIANDSYHAFFPADIGSGPVRVERGQRWLEYGLLGLHSRRVASGTTVRYALPDAVLALAATPTLLKEAIELRSAGAQHHYVYWLRLSPGLRPAATSGGAIVIRDQAGRIAFSLTAPVMADATGTVSHAVTQRLSTSAHRFLVTVDASSRWLESSARRWPVTIDPSVLLQPPSQECNLDGQHPTVSDCTSATIRVENATTGQKHALLQFAIPQAIPSTATVLNADLSLNFTNPCGDNPPGWTVYVYRVTRSWTTAATWNTYDGTHAWALGGGDYATPAAATAGVQYSGSYDWNPTSLVQSWINGSQPNDGMLLADSSSTCAGELDFDEPTAALSITWAPLLGAAPWFTFDSGVNIANGNLVLGGTDVSMGGIGIPLDVGRTYNGLSTGSSDFGNRWVMDAGADVTLQVAGDGSITFNGPTGIQAVFSKNADGTFTHPPGIDSTLVKNNDGSYTLTAHANGEQLAFSSSGVLSADTSSTGNTLAYNYSGGLLTSITDTLGQTTTFTYASPVSPNLISKITDAAGRTYQYGYDSNKNLTSYTTPNNETEQYAYDGSGRLTQITDPNGNETTFAYDTSNRVSSIINVTNVGAGTGPTTTFTYNSGNTVVTDPNSHNTTYTFDGQGRVTAVADANSHTTSTAWNVDNHVTRVALPSGATTSVSYDSSRENVTLVNMANGAKVSAAYGNASLPYYPTSVTDAQGNTSTITYNANGTVASEKDASGKSTSYTYNSNGTLASATDENNHTTSYTYGSNGLPQKDTPPSPLGTTQYSFNSYNLESGVTDGNGKATGFSYNLDGRLLAWSFADSTSVGYTYDADGNVTAMTDGSGTTSYTYNSLNELTSETLPNSATATVACPVGVGGANVNVSTCYAYDAAGNLTSKTDTWGTVSYSYDPANQLTGVTDRQGHAYTIGYDQDGNETSVGFPNGVTEAMAYDGAAQLTQITGTKGSSTLTSFSYSYLNPSTNTETSLPYSVTDASNNTTSFTYDTSNELTQALKKSGGGTTLDTWTYGYDPAGNLTSKGVNGTNTTFTYNAANELTAASGGMTASYTYDGNGDRTAATVAGKTQQISVNAASQITSITPSGSSAIPYTYTGTGEQTRTGAGTTTYQSDATGLIRQTDTNGDATYTTLPDGTLLGEYIPSGTCAGSYYYLADGAGSVAAVTNSIGAIKDSYSYDPLGNATSSGSVPNPFTFGSGMFDNQTGYYYTGSGYYDPATGQAFGCKDKGPYDTPGSEDFCGEDEAPYDDGSTTSASTPFAGGVREDLDINPISIIHDIGKAGENILGRILGLGKNYNPIRYASRVRIPDFWDPAARTIYEVKNVKYLFYTRQLRDFAGWAEENGYRFVLYVKKGARLSRPLLEAVEEGAVILEDFNAASGGAAER